MREEQGIFRPDGALPLVPPIEEDELISSWLDRSARFYGLTMGALLHRAGRPRRPVSLSAVDLGRPDAALQPVAAVLGTGVSCLAAHAIAAVHPLALGFVARGAPQPDGQGGPKLRYAACPHCLEQQRLERGLSWLCRAWVLAPRTVCSVHHVRLVAAQPGGTAHPVWSAFLHRYHNASLAVCATANALASALPASSPSGDDPYADLHREMALVQDAIPACARRDGGAARTTEEGRAVVAWDLTWALTRADRLEPDRLVYEAFASEGLDNPWHLARRRRPGPVDFTTLPLDERHMLLATATVLTGSAQLRQRFYPPSGSWQDDVGILTKRLRDADRTEWRDRRRRWPDAARVPDNSSPLSRLRNEISRSVASS